MKNFSRNQWYLIVGTVLLTLLIYLAPRNVNSGGDSVSDKLQSNKGVHNNHESIYQNYLDSILKKVAPQVKNDFNKLINSSLTNKNDSLLQFFKSLRQPFLAAKWAKAIAIEKNKAENWAETGKFYFIGFEFAPSAEVKHVAIDEAINAYSKASVLDSTNASYKIELATCIMEGGENPMQGIAILKEVLQKDSNNVAAQFKMGIFAVRSQQFEKAVARFKKVISIEPENTEAILYLGECYANLGRKEEAIKTLEKFKSLSKDDIINAEVDDFVEKLKNS